MRTTSSEQSVQTEQEMELRRITKPLQCIAETYVGVNLEQKITLMIPIKIESYLQDAIFKPVLGA